MKLDVQIEKHSILSNITHFFSKEDAYIQELLQNARRAEASRVEVRIDTQAGTLIVTDDGHGVTDPQSLLTIGKSDWAEAIKEETPAGMGFYSVFKVGSKASIRSKRFLLEMDLGELKQGRQATLTESLPKVNGTTVTVHSSWRKLLDAKELDQHAINAALHRWKRPAHHMPFTTTITIDGTTEVVQAFDPRKKPEGLVLRAERPWGYIDAVLKQSAVYDERFLLISQGVAVNTEKHLGVDRHGLNHPLGIDVHCKPGTVNFRLPDRDGLIDDDKLKAFFKDARSSLVSAAIEASKSATDKERRKHLASLVYALDEQRVLELPEDLQTIEFVSDNGYVETLVRAEVARRMKDGTLVFAEDVDERQLLQFLGQDVLMPFSRHRKLFSRMFPDAKLVTDFHVHVSRDARGETLWRVDKIKLAFGGKESREIKPVKDITVLARPEFGETLKAHDSDKHNKHDHDFIVVHSCEGEVGEPDLEPWHQCYDEDMSYEEADDLWRTGTQNLEIVSTWQGIPRQGVTLSEFSAILYDKLKVRRGSYISLRDADIEPWDDQMTVGKATIVIQHEGQPTRIVKLVPEDDRLRVEGETTEPCDDTEDGDATEEDSEESKEEESEKELVEDQ